MFQWRFILFFISKFVSKLGFSHVSIHLHRLFIIHFGFSYNVLALLQVFDALLVIEVLHGDFGWEGQAFDYNFGEMRLISCFKYPIQVFLNPLLRKLISKLFRNAYNIIDSLDRSTLFTFCRLAILSYFSLMYFCLLCTWNTFLLLSR